MAHTEAKIIDLAAYRTLKRVAPLVSPSQPSGQAAVSAFAMPVYGFWPVWVWMPFSVSPTFAIERDAL